MKSIKNRKCFEKINELVSLQNQVKVLRLHYTVGKQNCHERNKKSVKLVTKSIRDVTEDVTKTMVQTSQENNKALAKINNELLQIMNIRVISASSLLSLVSKITNPEDTSQYKLVKYPDSYRVSDLMIKKTKPAPLYNNLLTIRDTNKKLELEGDLLKRITNKN